MSGTRSFRSDIQGLRALAVGLVILAHAGFRTASGGFVGVDVFFVISGFLIIGLLLREAGESGRISILDFYARRARRVIPAATVVLVATAAASAYLLPLTRGQEVIKDSVWAAFFAANIRFRLVETDYFSQGEPPSPVQHYWSLSVEEQFYIVIPLLLLLVAVLVRRQVLRRATFAVLGVVALGSLAWSVHVTSTDPTGAYFSTAARAWETRHRRARRGAGVGPLAAAGAVGQRGAARARPGPGRLRDADVRRAHGDARQRRPGAGAGGGADAGGGQHDGRTLDVPVPAVLDRPGAGGGGLVVLPLPVALPGAAPGRGALGRAAALQAAPAPRAGADLRAERGEPTTSSSSPSARACAGGRGCVRSRSTRSAWPWWS
ncbi:acyltransferase [Nocardioides sp. W3-2-3]|uniref:acyltransferase family protein n=1 Tax=Nocardioides convexus TaxID=2712224 RepID=UPI0024188CB0|nr:acyltransferase [Nocardioides convexus]NHA00216.1 acyltransferase [Nocardioides convexus]